MVNPSSFEKKHLIHSHAVRAGLLFFIAFRLVTLLIMGAMSIVYPLSKFPIAVTEFPESMIDPEVVFRLEGQGAFSKYFLLPWYRWDTIHYLRIAENGYLGQELETVWPPLYPIMIKIAALVIGEPIAAGLTLSSFFSLIAFILLFYIVDVQWGENIAEKSLLFFTTFPTAYFLVGGYTEGLFLLLMLLMFYCSTHGKWMLAGLLAGLATLTRLQGVFLIFPLAWEMLSTKDVWPFSKHWRQLLQRVAALSIAPVFFLCYAGTVHFILGMDYPWITLSDFWSHHPAFPWEGIIGNIRATMEGKGFISLWVDCGVFLLSGLILIHMRKRLPATYQILGWLMLLVSAGKIDNNNLTVSLSRYMLPVFPVFIGMALLNWKKWALIAWCTLSTLLQIILLLGFYSWNWTF